MGIWKEGAWVGWGSWVGWVGVGWESGGLGAWELARINSGAFPATPAMIAATGNDEIWDTRDDTETWRLVPKAGVDDKRETGDRRNVTPPLSSTQFTEAAGNDTTIPRPLLKNRTAYRSIYINMAD